MDILSFFGVLLPASWYNFSQGDRVLAATYQFALDLGIIFLGAALAFWIGSIRVQAPDARALKIVSLALIVLGAVVVPAFFVVLWLLWKAGILTQEQTKQVSWGHLTGAGGLLSALVAWLSYRREVKKDTAAQSPTSVGD